MLAYRYSKHYPNWIAIMAFILCFALYGCIEGDKGPQGEQGPQGDKGEQGPQGIQGIPGEQGMPGIDAPCDKQIRLDVLPWPYSAGTTIGEIPDVSIIRHFNKTNYANISSIIFSALLLSNDSNTSCLVDLYNLTDDVPISNSLLEAASLTGIFVESGNIMDDLPESDIDLAVRIRREIDAGPQVEVRKATLLLYRDCN